MNPLRLSFAFAFVATLFTAACGSSGSSDDPVALCNQGCAKGISLCSADADATTVSIAKAACQSNCSSIKYTQAKSCSNSSAIIAAAKACLAKTTCDELTACGDSIPDCAGGGTGGSSGGGTGGSSGGGTGGSSGGGTGGSSGGGTGGFSFDGSIPELDGSFTGTCADFLACCNSITNAQVKALCMTQYNSAMAGGDSTCAIYVTSLKQEGVCP